uniref:Plastocyanin-like domain-containing protein n=1 Tax=Panagrolaimus davidi TaxID=227884 RepID=A0A914PCG7_9BILA
MVFKKIVFILTIFVIENVENYSEFAEPLKLAIPRSDGIYEFELVITEKLTMSTDGENGKVQVLDYNPDQYQSMPWYVRESDQEKPCEATNSWNSSYYNLSSLLQLHGLHQIVHSVNGKVPGEPIVVPYGAEIILTVFNQLLSSVMTLHVHGLDKKGLWYTDGVGFLQQCPIPPQTKYQYRFIADSPGTHWFHGHLGMDKGYGILGAFIVKKEKEEKVQIGDRKIVPSREYVMMLQDWTVATSNYIWFAQRWRTMKWQWGFDLEKLGRCWAPTRTYDFGAIGGV